MIIEKFNNNNIQSVLALDSGGAFDRYIGGTRTHLYSEDEAIQHAQSLADLMTKKYRVHNLPYSGAKLVVHQIDDRRKGFSELGEWLTSLDLPVYLAGDAGTSIDDLDLLHEKYERVLENSDNLRTIGSFTSFLAQGVLWGLQAGLEELYDVSTFKKKRVLVAGLGKTGSCIAYSLHRRGAIVSGYDIHPDAVSPPEGIQLIHSLEGEYDVFVPCGFGQYLDHYPDNLKFTLVGGSANLPFTLDEESQLAANKVLYIPDFVISSGAVVLDQEFVDHLPISYEKGIQRTKRIYEVTKQLIQHTKTEDISTKESALHVLEGAA
tara:strand:+ start:6005 stop:6967 length:963 start_codon:yes stop_codon:yes gene_type:complete